MPACVGKAPEKPDKQEESIRHPGLPSAALPASPGGSACAGAGRRAVYFAQDIDTIIAFASFLHESRKCVRRKVRSRRDFGGFPSGAFIIPVLVESYPNVPEKPEGRDQSIFFVVLHKDSYAHNNEYSPKAAAVFIHRNRVYFKLYSFNSSKKRARFEGTCIFLQKIVNTYSCCNFRDLVL